jgi:hypothetical protein
MSATTISAVLGKLGGISAHYNAFGELTDAQAFDDLDSELAGTVLDVDHNHEPVGEVVYVEVSPENWIGLVGVVDGDWIQEAANENPVYVSGEYVMRGRSSAGPSYIAELGSMVGAGLTWTPARVGDVRPVKLWPGDVRRSTDRRSWPISFGSQDPLLKRAVDHGSWASETLRVVDRRPSDDNPWQLRAGDRVPTDWQTRTLPGGLRRGPPGKILRVS